MLYASPLLLKGRKAPTAA